MTDLPRITDGQHAEIEALLAEYDPPKRMGRHRVPLERCLLALAYRLKTGCAWNSLPPALGDDSTAHRAVQRWKALGLYGDIVTILTPIPETES